MLVLRLAGAHVSRMARACRSLDKFVRGRSLAPGAAAAPADRSLGVRQGWTGNLLNPSVATFYPTIVPTFLPPGGGAAAFVVLAAIHVALAFACHISWALALRSA